MALSPLASFTALTFKNHSISLSPPPHVTFCQGGPAAVPAEHGIAAVHHSCQQCLLPEIYIIFAHTPASMSTHKVTEHRGHSHHKMLMSPPHSNPPAIRRTGNGVSFSHPCQRSARQIRRLMAPRLILVAGFQTKREGKEKKKYIYIYIYIYIHMDSKNLWIPQMHWLPLWFYVMVSCIFWMVLNVCCQQIPMQTLKY